MSDYQGPAHPDPDMPNQVGTLNTTKQLLYNIFPQLNKDEWAI